ncbi:hypothetical protein CC78DRAFT_588321 [Lojkania enalia]|uniref:Uncharacterized protein n=1 Tax=Lojkania enalia TaxID=147567 RepID=A0A9P4JW29_9PLEO|nr:hypothetical protein CC78DRAFT_588321 [Didymosphaeria enalia]
MGTPINGFEDAQSTNQKDRISVNRPHLLQGVQGKASTDHNSCYTGSNLRGCNNTPQFSRPSHVPVLITGYNIVVEGEGSNQARFQYEWKKGGVTINDSQNTYWRSLDSRLSIEIASNEHHQIKSENFGSPATFRFVLDSLIAADHENGTVVALIVPQSRVHIVQSDIISLRLVDCSVVKIIWSFSELHQLFEGGPIRLDSKAFPAAFAAAAGGPVLKESRSITIESLLRSLNVELSNYLSFPWLSTQEPKRKTLAVVEGGRYGPDNGGTGESIYAAAHALGIDMVVFDDARH